MLLPFPAACGLLLRATALSLLGALLLVATGCPDGSAALSVDLRTDYAASEVDTIEITLDGASPVSRPFDAAGYVAARRVIDFAVVARGRHQLELRLARAGTVVSRRIAIVVVDASRVVMIALARSCDTREPPCPAGSADLLATACDFTGCVRPECLPDAPESCPPALDGGALDAGESTEAGAPDATADAPTFDGGPDAPPACPADPCAGVTCSGHGWCVDGTCTCDPGHSGAACDLCTATWVERTPGECAPPGTTVFGTIDADTMLRGTSLADEIDGLSGDDLIYGLNASDRIHGRAGMDTIDGEADADELRGGTEDDVLRGGDGDDALFGEEGSDVLLGGVGRDRLVGGPGNDQLRGETGNDHYVIDGLGDDILDEGLGSGSDTARCVDGLFIVRERLTDGYRVLELSNGTTARIFPIDGIEDVYCCRAP